MARMGEIRSMHFRQRTSISEIAWLTSLSQQDQEVAEGAAWRSKFGRRAQCLMIKPSFVRVVNVLGLSSISTGSGSLHEQVPLGRVFACLLLRVEAVALAAPWQLRVPEWRPATVRSPRA